MTLSRIATHRLTEDALLEACIRSGQADSRQIAGHVAAGELRLTPDEMGYEAALPIELLGPEPHDDMDEMLTVSQAIAGALAVVCLIGAFVWLLHSVWPVLVVALG